MEETANEILKLIPQPVDVEEVTNKYPVLYEQSMNTVLIQEIIRYVLSSACYTCTCYIGAFRGVVVNFCLENERLPFLIFFCFFRSGLLLIHLWSLGSAVAEPQLRMYFGAFCFPQTLFCSVLSLIYGFTCPKERTIFSRHLSIL